LGSFAANGAGTGYAGREVLMKHEGARRDKRFGTSPVESAG
jgi:hypothetical protein